MVQSCLWVTPLGRSLDCLLRHVPLGPAWQAMRTADKRAHRMMTAFAGAYEDAWAALCNLVGELNPFTTSQLLPEWEGALGLPDRCLPVASTEDQRRAQLIFRLTKRRWTTVQDWKDLAALFGLTIIVTPGWYAYELVGGFPRNGRFRVYIDFVGLESDAGYVYRYPLPYGQDALLVEAFVCLIDRIRPANVVVIFNANPVRNFCYAGTYEETYSDIYCGVLALEAFEADA